MRNKLLPIIVASAALLSFPKTNFGQAPNLGTAANYTLFTSVGAVTNSGITYLTHITGNVGSNSATTITGFGNVDGVMTYSGGALSAQCASDLLAAYDSLGKAVVDSSIGVTIGGNSIRPGTYLMPGAASLSGTFTLDAKGNSNAVFIFKTANAFSTSVNSKIRLINGALACNVFWKLDGAVTIAAGTIMRGTIISGGAISLGSGDTLEGRALTINGAVMVDSVMAYTPVGCGSPTLTGPAAPALASTSCWAIFSGNGAVTNGGTSIVVGDVGTNVGLTTGYNALDVTGTIHPKPDGATAACATDLGNVYTYLNTLPADIELLFPAQLGHGLVLTPHTYIMKAAVTFVDTLYLNGEGNANAVFVIQVNGAVSTGVNSKIKLINGTQAKNVFWKVDGAVNINSNSTFIGTIICNNGAISIHSNSTLTGGAFTTNGQFTTDTLTIDKTSTCAPAGIASIMHSNEQAITLYPNPFKSSITISVRDLSPADNYELKVYNVLGKEVMSNVITNQTTILGTNNLASGMYFYQLLNNNVLMQSGKLVSQN